MYNICDWCFQEYNKPATYIHQQLINVTLRVCSEECKDQINKDVLEDIKYERKFGKNY